MTQALAPQLRGIAHQLRQIRPAPAGLETIVRQIEVLASECERRVLMSAEHRMAILQILDSLEDLGRGKPKRIMRLRDFSNAVDRLNEIIEQFMPQRAGGN